MAAKRRRRSRALPALLVGGMIAAASATAVTASSAYGTGGRHQAPPQHSAGPADAGTLSGVATLAGPTGAAAGSWVVFTLNGPGRVVRTDTTPPFQLTLDTRTLPNGAYTFTAMMLAPNQPPSVTTRVVHILNQPAPPGAAPRPPVATPTPTARATTRAPARPTAAPAPVVPDSVTEVVTRTNAERARYGCRALRLVPVLTAVAQAHSTDMATHDYFSHDSQNGATPFDRMAAAGYRYTTAGENIAAGQDTPAEVLAAWMNSPGHRANILNCAFTQIGVGYTISASSRYGTYWTQDFGTPS